MRSINFEIACHTDRLRRSVLCRVSPKAPLTRLLDGTKVAATLAGQWADRELFLDAVLKPIDGPRHKFALQASWPEDVDPIGLVLGRFDLAHGRQPVEVPIELNVNAPRQAWQAWEAAAKHANEPRVETDPDFAADRSGKTLAVWGKLPDGRTTDQIALELRYVRTCGDVSSVVHAVSIEMDEFRHQIGKAQVNDFPWPSDVGEASASLVVGPLCVGDMPKLSPTAVSRILAAEPFTVVTLSPFAGGHEFELRYAAQQRSVADPNQTLFVRVALAGTEARP